MRKNSVKNIRINGEVQKALSEIIRSELKDPRIHPMTSVVQVSVTPVIFFVLEQSIEYGVRMSKLIDEVTKDLPDEDDKEENDDQ